MTIVLLVLLLFVLIFSAVPVCWAIGGVGLIGMLVLDSEPLSMIPQCLYSGINYFPLLAIPFFIFAGEIMNKGGITKKLVELSKLIVGRVPGSLAHVNIISSMFFGGITGSAQADTSCIGGVLIPAMKEEGYSSEVAVAVTASSSCIGPIIPPSIIMVLYACVMNVSIGAMFMGGIVPGILIGLALMGVVVLQNRKYHFPRATKAYKHKEVKRILIQSMIPMGMPVIILGGILTGLFTATEAGAMSVLYSLVVSVLFLKTVKWRDLIPMLKTTGQTTGTVLMIIACSKILSWVLALLHVQDLIGNFVDTYVSSVFVFLMLVNILLLFMGTFMDASASLILLAPILAPIAVQYGINPVHFGLIMCTNLVIGHATPPMGLCLFVGCKLGKVSLGKAGAVILPYVVAEVVVLLLITYIPAIPMTLPTYFMR